MLTWAPKFNSFNFVSSWSHERLKTTDHVFLFQRSSQAFAFLTKQMAKTKGRKIRLCLPFYICEELVAPLRDHCEFLFYEVDNDLQPLEPNLSCDVFLFVHYFGRLSTSKELRQHLKAKNITVIEDGAHLLTGQHSLFSGSDVVFTSPHKFVQIPGGSVLALKNLKLLTASFLADYAALPMLSQKDILRWYVRRTVLDSWIGPQIRKQMNKQIKIESNGIRSLEENSRVSPHWVKYFEKQKSEIRRFRLVNYEVWLELFRAERLTFRPLVQYSTDETPYMCGIQLNSPESMTELRAKFPAIPFIQWPGLPRECQNNKSVKKMRDTTLFVPIHQNISPANIRRYFA